MKRLSGLLAAGFLFCIAFAGASPAQPPRDPAKEQPFYQQLQKIAPKAVDPFKKATEALDAQNYADAVISYREVLKQAPDFEPALRRLGYTFSYLGQRAEGLAMTKKALDLNRSADNLIGHAINLSSLNNPGFQPTDSEIKQALALAREGVQKDTGNDPDYPLTLAELAIRANDGAELDNTVKILNFKYPDNYVTHYYTAISLASKDDLNGAEAEIEKAEALGMPREAAAPLLTAIGNARDQRFFGLGKYFYYGSFVLLAWVIGLAVLFIAGKVLSSKMIHSIETGDPNDITGSRHAGLRKLYRIVVSIAGVYYFLSQPIVMLLVIVATLGIILAFVWAGTIPVKILLVIAFVGAASIFYMVKSLLVRTKTEDPGRALTEDEAPGLWETAREVAAAVNTRPVNEIRITPGTELAVYERGGMRRKMQDKADRILILGVAVINDFDQNAFRAVLAHEYGHFSNRDTAGGDIAFRVNQHIFRLADAMGRSGTATFYNIAFQFLRLYHFLFRRISHGASRLQEVLADRVAVYQYGAAAFREGLTHVVRRDVEFNHVAEKEINASYAAGRAMRNIYDLTIESVAEKDEIETRFDETMNRTTTEDDTHPSPADRFRLVERIASRETASATGKVWDLFNDRENIIGEMNKMVVELIRAGA